VRSATLGLCACSLGFALLACVGPSASRLGEVERGSLRIGRECELHGTRFTLDARFDIAGPEVVEVDTGLDRGAPLELTAGSYVISIRPDFTLWRDVAVARVEVVGELVSDEQQRFEIADGTSTLVAYEFTVDGETAAFDSD
jgi:hypothetical protein